MDLLCQPVKFDVLQTNRWTHTTLIKTLDESPARTKSAAAGPIERRLPRSRTVDDHEVLAHDRHAGARPLSEAQALAAER